MSDPRMEGQSYILDQARSPQEALHRMKTKTEKLLPTFEKDMAQGDTLRWRIYEVVLAATAFVAGIVAGLIMAGIL